MLPTSGEWPLPASGLFSLDTRREHALVRAAREVWRHLPAWLFLLYGCALLHCELANLSPPRPELAPTALFPLSVFTVYYVARALAARDVRRRRTLVACTLGLAFGLPALLVVAHRPFPIATGSLRSLYEASTFVWVGLLALHALRHARALALVCFGAGLLYGALLENGGILLGFFQETHLASRVPPLAAPIATTLGWSMVLYMAFFVVRGLRAAVPWLRRSALLSAGAVAGAALLLDLQLDPLATALGCWVWAPGLPESFHGVPLVNFVAWVSAVFPFAYVVFRHQERRRLSDHRPWELAEHKLVVLATPAVLGVAGALFLLGVLVLEGPQGPGYELLYRFTARLFGS